VKRWTALALAAFCLTDGALGFMPTAVPAGRSIVRPSAAIGSLEGRRFQAYQSASAPLAASFSTALKATAAASTDGVSDGKANSYGPHIKVGKSGAILNLWGLWVMTYSVMIAIVGWAYLKLRILLGFLTMGLLKPSAEHCCWIMHAWCKLVLWLGFSNPKVTGLENLPPKGETVLVAANHMSWYDVPSISGYLGDRQLWSFAKAELVKVPILGTYMKSAEHILISRQSRKSQMESLKSAIATIKKERDVFIFPEGTRSLDGKLREFKGGAFTIARKTGAKIVPVTLLGNDKVFPSNALMPIRPGKGLMELIVHPAIETEGKEDAELMELTRKAIASALPAEKQ